jgi:translocation and assembly module TamB
MAQSRQLSWLVLGRDLETNASDEERSAMNEAALMLGLGGGELLGQRIGEKIGVDEVSIASEPGAGTSQASLLVGKYLSPELLVSYGIGLFEPVSTLRLRYTLSSRWKLVGEASAERSSADIFYIIERGE